MLEKKKKSKALKKKEKDKEKEKEKRIREEEYKKYRCQAITHEGKQCLRKSDIILDLREGVKLKGIKVIPEIDCCLFCKQHFRIKASELTTRVLFEGYLYLLTKDLPPEEKTTLDIDKFYRELENIDKTGNKWGKKF
jgi:hypothetical protein